jgi:Acetylornithine deacetylase/Succinyl-diaminopimelate desuccinylase and related deacylases
VATKTEVSDVLAYAQSVRGEYESNLKKIVDLPSVSMEPERIGDIRATAEFARDLLLSAGAQAEIVETKGYPVVIGEFHYGEGVPTVSIYNHLDVQPALPSEWIAPPFDMQIDNGVYKGRGTTDDKGPALAVFYAAKYAAEKKSQ